MNHVFVGFGFGPIQAGLFVKEARGSGRFSEIAVAEVDPALVAAVRGNGNQYALNVASPSGVDVVHVKGVTLLNPNVADDLHQLRLMLGRATEMVTSLPSVAFYTRGGETSVARLIAEGLRGHGAEQTVVYTAENNNHAAEILARDVQSVSSGGSGQRPVQALNTVIGKMSQVISEPSEIERRGLEPIAPGFPRAFLVESFNRILVSQIHLPGFDPGIAAFEGKEDLLPFEEAKLYGHNAAHTMLGFLGKTHELLLLSDLRSKPALIALVRKAFLCEAGEALIARHGKLGDPLFTREGFRMYADDLLLRMTNPHLSDTVARAIRDPVRKLGYSDRLFGAMRLCLTCGIEPECLAVGALTGLYALSEHPERPQVPAFNVCRRDRKLTGSEIANLLAALWADGYSSAELKEIAEWVERAQSSLL